MQELLRRYATDRPKPNEALKARLFHKWERLGRAMPFLNCIFSIDDPSYPRNLKA